MNLVDIPIWSSYKNDKYAIGDIVRIDDRFFIRQDSVTWWDEIDINLVIKKLSAENNINIF